MQSPCWESFIISLDILIEAEQFIKVELRIFHYQPWYTYPHQNSLLATVENLSLSALIYLRMRWWSQPSCWESFIISLDILTDASAAGLVKLRIFHYQPWYTYTTRGDGNQPVENLSLSALIYLSRMSGLLRVGWESFIISLDILTGGGFAGIEWLRIFHYQPWYT